MSTYRIAHRYAGALMKLTAELKKPEAAAADLMTVKNALESSRELRLMLESPIISADKKKDVLSAIFTKKIGEAVRDYLLEIISKGRAQYLHQILVQYFELRDDSMGIVRVAVQTPVEFSAKQKKDLEKHLEAFTGKKVAVAFSLDASIKGGFIARVGDTVLDGSIRRRLELLKSALSEGGLKN
ncbi:MAG TPA: ATP synthase F1 subunit delta [Bacteroidota bacterium]|nr:ATP synthase F1 subunit delta [Bacteroidota bacterium]